MDFLTFENSQIDFGVRLAPYETDFDQFSHFTSYIYF